MSDRTGVPVTSSQLATPMIKVVVNTDEEAFLELPPILDPLLRPAIMQLNRDETAVELFSLDIGVAAYNEIYGALGVVAA